MKQKNTKMYVCDNCGEESLTWAGKCSHCNSWNSLKEIFVTAENTKLSNENLEYKKISEIDSSNNIRLDSGISELNGVLGGGFVKGSVVLLGGEPGIGKSTITSQICNLPKKILYLSAEESLPQIKDRLVRLKINNDKLVLASGGDLLALEKKIQKEQFDFVIVDSIQTVFISELNTSAGSISQVKESGLFLQKMAKKYNVTTVIIGHVTKDGTIAGPKIIEHLVDVVLYLEGDKNHQGRGIRGIKNRFGATNEIGLFLMTGEGLQEVTNPSEMFLSQRQNKPGSVICSVVEGKRILFIEIQAISVITKYGYAKRTCSGYDLNRLSLLSAVIQKNIGIDLSSCDIYLNVVGGIKIKEPAADLAVCAAIISSYKNKSYEDRACFFGEVGLMGEIRKVILQKERIKESKKMGYQPVSSEDIKEIFQISSNYL
jgi:DNA repair protein RadA/Sms